MSSDPSLPKSGPVLESSVEEVQGIFPSDAALQDAIGRLTRAGFDRATLSLPSTNPAPATATPAMGAENPDTEDDSQQERTLHTSMAASVGAMVGAGLTVATGGAALVAGAAALGLGAAAGAVMEAVTRGVDASQHAERQEAAAAGQLVLAVNIQDPARREIAAQLMREAGATRVAQVERRDSGLTIT